MLQLQKWWSRLVLLAGAVGLLLVSAWAADKCAVSTPGAKAAMEQYRPRLLLELGEDCNTPDGARLDPKTGDVIVACPNFNGNAREYKYPGKLMRITPDNKWLPYFDKLPPHPDTGRACPMGLDFGPDGNLYYADNQYFYDKNYKSRLIRVNIRDGKPVGADVVVDGFKLSNAVMWKGDYVYVSDTFFDLPDRAASGVYRFSLAELNKGPVRLRPKGEKDPHLVAEIETKLLAHRHNEKAGADGITFDSQGNLYTGNFGDGQLFMVAFDQHNNPQPPVRVAGPPDITCVDGIFYDAKRDVIYIADSERNAIQVYDVKTRKIWTLWENDDTDGANGLLDQPCEPTMRGDELIVINFDMPFPGLKNTKFDKPHTISVIKLK